MYIVANVSEKSLYNRGFVSPKLFSNRPPHSTLRFNPTFNPPRSSDFSSTCNPHQIQPPCNPHPSDSAPHATLRFNPTCSLVPRLSDSLGSYEATTCNPQILILQSHIQHHNSYILQRNIEFSSWVGLAIANYERLNCRCY